MRATTQTSDDIEKLDVITKKVLRSRQTSAHCVMRSFWHIAATLWVIHQSWSRDNQPRKLLNCFAILSISLTLAVCSNFTPYSLDTFSNVSKCLFMFASCHVWMEIGGTDDEEENTITMMEWNRTAANEEKHKTSIEERAFIGKFLVCVREKTSFMKTRSKKFFLSLLRRLSYGAGFFVFRFNSTLIGVYFFCVSRSLMLSFLRSTRFSFDSTIFMVTLLLFTFFSRFPNEC